MELVGVHPTCLLKKTWSSFEEAHHWNIQAKFYSVKDPHIVICMYDKLYGVQRYKMEYECGSVKRNSSVPPSLFFFGGLHGSFYLTLICPLWDLLILSSLGSFSHFRGNTLYITRNIEDISHFTKVLNIKKM